MKRILRIYLIVLVGIFFFLELLDLNGDYGVEKKLWRLNKQYAEIARDPAAAPANEFAELVEKYGMVIKEHPRSKLIPNVYLLIGQVYIAKKDYTSARAVLAKVPEQFPNEAEISTRD